MIIEVLKKQYAPLALHATPAEYDALPPVDTLFIDHLPTSINADRLAIAAFLAFGSFASGEFSVPNKISAAAAEAIERAAEPTRLRPYPVEYYPKALPEGAEDAALNFMFETWTTSPAVCVLPSDRFNGSIASHKGLAVSSNAFLLDALSPVSHSIRARLAVAVLFAEDFGIASFTVPAEVAEGITAVERVRLEELLASCRLSIRFADAQ